MEAMRESWTDDRMDALNRRVDDGFTQVDQRFDRVEADLRDLRVETRTEFAAVRQESAALRQEMNARFDAMQRLILQVGGGMIATTMVGFLGLVATQL
jgi:hypothetical protein